MPYLSNAAMAAIAAGQNPTVSLRKGKYRPAAKRRTYAGASARAPTAKNAMAIRKVAGEKKGVDTVLTNTDIVATMSGSTDIDCVNLIRAGSGSMNRVGRKIFLKSVRVKGVATLTLGPEATTFRLLGNVLRMLIVWDKQPSGALPAITDIFSDTPQDGVDVSTVFSLPRYDNMNRFQILRDVMIKVTPTVVVDGGTQDIAEYPCPFDEYVKLGNRQTVYGADSSPAVIGDISSGGLYVVWRAKYNTASVSRWSIDDTSIARLRYSD